MSIQNRISAFTAILLSCIIGICLALNPPGVVISWDVFGYYLYLPGFFIQHDVGFKNFEFIQHIIDTYHTTGSFYQATLMPTGYWVNKYSMGMAVLYSPAFFVAHLYAKIAGYPADGFSAPYQFAMVAGSFVYTLIGIYFLRKILLKYFNDKVAAVVIVLIGFGTNYFHSSVYSGSMPHNYIFTLYCILIWVTIKWHEEQKMRYAIAAGIICGLCTLSRPSEMISVLIPLLWGINNKADLVAKLHMVRKNWIHVITAIAVALLVGFPQLVYWKALSGKWLLNSYDTAGEGFDFFKPYFLEVLFSFRKGWLVYTPVMVFAVLGFFFMKKYKSTIFYSIFIFFLVNLYIISSWSCWWYADSFSQRALIQSYPLLAFPLGYFIQWVSNRNWFVQSASVVLFLGLVALNFFQTWQVSHGIIHSSRMTKEYYFAVFGKTKISENDQKLLMVFRDYVNPDVFSNIDEYNEVARDVMDFEESGSKPWAGRLDTAFAYSGKYSFKMDSTCIYSPNFIRKYRRLTDKDHAWVRISAWVYPVKKVSDNPFTIITSLKHKGRDYKYNGLNLLTQDIVPGKWNKIQMDYLTPDVRNTNDSLFSYIWLQGKDAVYIDDFRMEVFEKK